MRVVCTVMLSPGASDAAQLDCKKGQNQPTLGRTSSPDLEKGESDELASSCVWVRVMSAYEWYVVWSVSVRVCGIRDGLHKSTFNHIYQALPGTPSKDHMCMWKNDFQWYCWGGSAVVDLHRYPDRRGNVTFSTKSWHWKLLFLIYLYNDSSNQTT